MGYKIYIDMAKIDLNILYNKMSSIADFIVVDNTVYVWLYKSKTKRHIINVLTASKIQEYFIQQISTEEIKQNGSFVGEWLCNHDALTQREKFEEQKQQELQAMMDNIKQADQLYDSMIQEKNKEVQSNDRENRKETGTSAENQAGAN